MVAEDVSLYSHWKKIYPRYQVGFFRNLRWLGVMVFLGVYYITPLIRWERSGGLPNQAVLFDLPERKFYIFNLVIWPQEVYLLALLLIAAAIGLFFMTALAGRVFCGFMCIQTVWTDLFLQVERLVEGNRKQRIRLDQSPWNVKKWALKVGKHCIWLVISLATGVTFVFYFANVPTMAQGFMDGSAPFAAWMTLGLLASTTYTMAGFAREQVCIYMCPYARFQGAMIDDDTIMVAYRPDRGEPRESNRRKRGELAGQVGLCIDCEECVTVCPTGIDIRNGQQYECICCGACIDACDVVRSKMKMPKALINYTSLRDLNGKPTRWLRFRVLAYGVLLSGLLGAIVIHFILRTQVELNVVHHRQPTYISLSDGSIQNNFTIRSLNMSHKRQTYALDTVGIEGSSLSVAAVSTYDDGGRPLLTLEPGEVAPFTVYLKQDPASIKPGSQEFTFRLVALDPQGGEINYKSIFMRP